MKLVDLEGRVALITGGATGIGRATAEVMLALGAKVVITGRREELLRQAAAELGPSCAWRTQDVIDSATHEPLLAAIEAEIGPVDILVNNAGINKKAPSTEFELGDFERIIATNLTSVFGMSRAAARHMVPRGRGSILMIASMASVVGLPQVAAYSAAKTGVMGLVRSLAVEWGPAGIRVNAVLPGFIDTDMFRNATRNDPARLAKIKGRIAMGSIGDALEIGRTAAFLCSDAAAYVTGQGLAVDGGFSIGF